MTGSLARKVSLLLGNMLVHPNYIPRYLTHSLLAKRSPLDLEIPWFAWAAIDFLDSHLNGSMTVFEYGSGGSTLYFAARVGSVLSVEDDPKWSELVNARLRQKHLFHATVQLRSADFTTVRAFEESDYFRAMPDTKFDVVVIDSSEVSSTAIRPVCFRKAEQHVKRNGIILVDDSWRYPGLREDNRASDVKIFQGVGPFRRGVTSTDVYFY